MTGMKKKQKKQYMTGEIKENGKLSSYKRIEIVLRVMKKYIGNASGRVGTW